MDKNKRVAIFIDAENLNAKDADEIINESQKYGEITIKKIYGDWSKENLKPWKEEISKHSLVAEQQFSFAKNKDSSDVALMIQVLLTLFEKNIDVFCIISGDSDFTRLVQELREREKVVIGMGGKNAIPSYINSFSEYIYLGEKVKTVKNTKTSGKNDKVSKKVISSAIKNDRLDYLNEVIELLIDAYGKALLSQVTEKMKVKFSDFIPKNYGHKSMKNLINECLQYLQEYKLTVDSDHSTYYIENK